MTVMQQVKSSSEINRWL